MLTKRNKYQLSKIIFIIFLILNSYFTLFHNIGKENINVDQFLWKNRTENFFEALNNKEYNKTLQQYHPGVLFIYLIKLGYIYNNIDKEPFTKWDELTGEKFINLNSSIKIVIQVFNLLLIILIAFLISKLFDKKASIFFYFLTINETYFVGILRNLHMDGILSLIIVSTILSFIVFLNAKDNKYLFMSIFLGGMGLLIKSVSIFSFFSIGLISLFSFLHNKNIFTFYVRALFFYFMGTFFIFFIFFPAMWSEPLNTLYKIYVEGILGVGISGEDNFVHHFGDNIETKNPGAFFYLNVIYFRFSNFLLIGTLISVIALILNKLKFRIIHSNLILPVYFYYLSILPLIYFSMITISSKKTDRYLSIFIVFALVLVSIVIVNLLNYKNKLFLYISIFLCSTNILINCLIHPYYFAFYNPILGGVNRAKKTLYINQGGIAYIEVIKFLNTLNLNSEQKIGIFNKEEFRYTTKLQINSLDINNSKTRYIKIPTIQRGRNLLSNTDKIYSVNILGQPWWQIYKKKD